MERQLKYRILEILSRLPPSERRAKRQAVIEALNERRLLIKKKEIRSVMFSRYVNATSLEMLDFDGMELLIIAQVLNCKVEELFTQVEKKESC